ncbi:MAG: VWA domain-containing protein [Nitrospinota bacterium]
MLEGQTQAPEDGKQMLPVFRGAGQKDFAKNLLAFCRALRGHQVKVTTGKVLDLYKSLKFIDLTRKEDFRAAARSNLISSYEELKIFDELFDEFWGIEQEADATPDGLDSCGPEGEPPPFEDGQGEDGEETGQEGDEEGAEGEGEGEQEEEFFLMEEEDENPEGEEGAPSADEDNLPSYSPHEVLAVKDFGSIKGDEIEAMRKLIAELAPKLATRLSRRKTATPRKKLIDMRRTIRKNLRYGGEIVRLFHRKQKIKKNDVVLLCDVSGSMDAYSQFLVQFIYSLQAELKNIETAVFSTRLTIATPYLKEKDLHKALARLSEKVHDWSGGTNIGGCLKTFNERWGGMMVSKRTIVIIISDGWDRGEIEVLDRELRRLQSRARRLIWLNPLLGSPGYKPIDRGMRTALPDLDQFLPAHNLNALTDLAETISLD